MFTETFQATAKIVVPVIDSDFFARRNIAHSSKCIEPGWLNACALVFNDIPELRI